MIRLYNLSLFLLLFLLASITNVASCFSWLRRSTNNNHKDTTNNTIITTTLHDQQQLQEKRNLQQQSNKIYYYKTKSLGTLNYDVTIGNPLKGFVGNPITVDPKDWPTTLPSTIHAYKFPLSQVMFGDPDVIGANAAFNWKIVDDALAKAQQYKSHAIIRFFVHWPGTPLKVPSYLLNSPYNIQTVWNNEVVPWYGDPKLRRALEQFIDHFARKYDGDTRLMAVQAGLIGAWGEWHTLGCTYNWDRCDTDQSKQEIVSWFAKYWKKTKIQFRYPERKDAYSNGFGFHDDSFSYETVSGIANGGINETYFFWNSSVVSGTSTFWKNSISGGEVRPENQDMLQPWFPAGTRWHQDPLLCIETTHATFLDWGKGFVNGGVSGTELENARKLHSRLGYNFQLINVALTTTGAASGRINIDATIRQVGVAPFYYPLYLDVYCNGIKRDNQYIGADLSTKNSRTVIEIKNIPATTSCLSALEFQLGSYYLQGTPIKWAQGNGRIVLNLPLPTDPSNNNNNNTNGGSVPVQVRNPVRRPVRRKSNPTR